MDWFSGIIVYLMVWWTALFCVLPWGNKAPSTPEDGMAGSAPKNPRIKQKFIATTLVSAIIWVLIYALIESELINFYDYALELEK